jgi:hypothetical protein
MVPQLGTKLSGKGIISHNILKTDFDVTSPMLYESTGWPKNPKTFLKILFGFFSDIALCLVSL